MIKSPPRGNRKIKSNVLLFMTDGSGGGVPSTIPGDRDGQRPADFLTGDKGTRTSANEASDD